MPKFYFDLLTPSQFSMDEIGSDISEVENISSEVTDLLVGIAKDLAKIDLPMEIKVNVRTETGQIHGCGRLALEFIKNQ